MKLTPKQRQFLKAEAHHLRPSLRIGKDGITPALLHELDSMAERLELLKVRLDNRAFEDEAVVASLIAGVPGLTHVWTIGHTFLFFRPARNRPSRYVLPDGKGGVTEG